ncbi:YhcN/YlaJ family sporulation lipoprotein [Cytobacillus horneckiae]|uniref:YhcN/YlaJ family sporulation lipoprotein n=1 Tax=Cytobacillus horneckiae TaxID=549687 RepID=A0A2N0ZKE1_9BACI|nr:YhcN/YlaJ family sporulation lipoprotein [Cytobacillus horneckiae]MBN6889184.1 YhcN/YlaJ family sporulation lipoprotein [Cytobacillus horneckiae]MCM3178402.1 YhcN/YlaJ family sporulation lipoprotein [Cytobacillus horneckiae]MEC1156859.1 YhcN/YlaJ family sporulation lipoprotein [Cytobacillus horneckiae]MED2940458.1 YhcN/YlaJ family sporulation lipoprotein [Cytobacillus horneckiae]PKG29982.1 YhcN/YlaJ family sporulation lipoprotein [Cytobacillus horneckiae]
MKHAFFILALSVLLTACGTNNESLPPDNDKDAQHIVNVKNSTIEHQDRESGQQISQHLVKLASQVQHVNDATAVVIGDYAIVGIDIDANIERSEVGSIKYSVAESLKHDPHGANAMIIADPDLYARLQEIGEDIRTGQPIEGIMNELSDITGRLIPEIPADIVDPNTKQETEAPKQQMNEAENKQLEKKQQEQSNYHK